MTDIYNAIDRAEDAIRDVVAKGILVEPEQLGLDDRASYGKLVIDENHQVIIAQSDNDARVLCYYGGFEYIEPEDVKKVGQFTIFMDGSRVRDALEHYREVREEKHDTA